MTLIQRFGSALNLNIHFHMSFLDGVYEVDSGGAIGRFHGIKPPTSLEVSLLLGKISERIARLLEQAGYLEREEGDGLKLEGFEDEAMNHFQGSSMTYKIAVGSQKGRKVLTIKTLPSRDREDESNIQTLAKASGFSLHAGVCGIYSSNGAPCGWSN